MRTRASILHRGAFAVIRLEPDGTIDEGFGNRGLALIGFSDSDDRAYAVQVQQDGKIAVVGESHDGRLTRGICSR